MLVTGECWAESACRTGGNGGDGCCRTGQMQCWYTRCYMERLSGEVAGVDAELMYMEQHL